MTYEIMGDDRSEGRWAPVTMMGADGGGRVTARVVWRQDGQHLHAWAKFRGMNGQVVLAHASTDLAAMEREIDAKVLQQLHMEHGRRAARDGHAVAGGWFKRAFRKAKKALKKIAKKTGVVKVLKAVHKVVNKALDNPWVQKALASNPWGAAILAGRKATQIAWKAFKGSKLGKSALRKLAGLAKSGNRKARNVLGLMAKGIRAQPKMFKRANPSMYDALMKVKPYKACVAGDDAIDALIEGCADVTSPPVSGEYHAVMGDDADAALGEDLDFVETFASSGAFEGARWLVDRLGPHSMDNHPDEFTARGAYLWGRSAQAARFAHV